MKKVLLLFLFFPLVASAANDSVVTFSAESLSQKPFSVGDTATIHFTVTLQKGWHVYANQVINEFLIPSRLDIKTEGVKIVNITYPKGEKRKLMDIVDFLYAGKTVLPVKILITTDDPKKLDASFYFQACNDRVCLPPATKSLIVQLP